MNKSKQLLRCSMITALYVVLTLLSNMLGLASGVIQVRLSEILTILPVFTPMAIPSLFIGCIISNILTGASLIDIVFGSIATLIGAIGTYKLKNNIRLAPIPTILSNAVILPFVLAYSYHIQTAIPLMMIFIGLGELISAGLLGIVFYNSIKKYKIF